MLDLFVDIENCPVYPQLRWMAERYSLDLYVVTRDYLKVDANVHLILAQEDDFGVRRWIAANISGGDICVTDDLALASACIARSAMALASTGAAWVSDRFMASTSLHPPDNPSFQGKCQKWAGNPRIFAQRLESAIVRARAAIQQTTAKPGPFNHGARARAASWTERPRTALR